MPRNRFCAARDVDLDALARIKERSPFLSRAARRPRTLHDPHLAMWESLADGQQGPETSWGDLVTDEEYNEEYNA